MWQDYLKVIPEKYHNKYNRPGIYCIKIGDILVYIGKSKNMLERLCGHLQSIDYSTANKYKVLRDALAAGYKINFDVVEWC